MVSSSAAVTPSAGAGQCADHFIPLRQAELVETLCADAELPANTSAAFQRFCGMVVALCHHEFHARLRRLKSAYAPFDPDAEAIPLRSVSAEQKQQRLNALMQQFIALMEQANYRHLDCREIEPTLRGANHLGLRIDVDFRVFERLALFVRGEGMEKRKRRQLRRPWRTEEYEIPVYRRLVMMLKLRPHKRLGRGVNTEGVFFQLFKNIPKRDITMLLPGARARISRLDRGKIGFGLISGLGLTLWRILQEVSHNIVELLNVGAHPAAIWGLATGTIGYGAKSLLGYHQTRKQYHLRLTEVLYFQNLDTNAGVLHRVLDEGEEQFWHEIVLGYHALWRHAGTDGWTSLQLDEYVENDLQQRVHMRIDFDVRTALAGLERLHIVERVGERYRARPLDDVLRVLDRLWEKCFE